MHGQAYAQVTRCVSEAAYNPQPVCAIYKKPPVGGTEAVRLIKDKMHGQAYAQVACLFRLQENTL